MDNKKWVKSKGGGFALAVVLCVVTLLLIVGAGLLSVGSFERLRGVRTSSEIAARNAADTGLTKALFTLNIQLEKKIWNENNLPHVTNELIPNSDATFSYNVAKATSVDGNDLYTLTCVGRSGRYQKTVNCLMELKGIFEYAIYVSNNLTLKNGTTISAYNKQPGDPPLQIGTNSTAAGAITAKTGVKIDGDVVVGPGGDPTVVINNPSESNITGQIYPSLVKHKTPDITVPQYLADMVSSGTIVSSTTLSSPAKYNSINLTGTSTDPNKVDKISVSGDVQIYVTGDLRLGNGDVVEIPMGGGSLTIFLGGNLFVDNSGAINNLTKDPQKLKIFGLDTCTNIDFKNSGTFYGAIYAPDADIHLYNGFTVYGAIVGKSFLQDVNANFYYDMNLREVDATMIGVYLVVKRWSEL